MISNKCIFFMPHSYSLPFQQLQLLIASLRGLYNHQKDYHGHFFLTTSLSWDEVFLIFSPPPNNSVSFPIKSESYTSKIIQGQLSFAESATIRHMETEHVEHTTYLRPRILDRRKAVSNRILIIMKKKQ